MKALVVDYLVLDNYVKTAISNVRVLKSVPEDSRVALAQSLLDKIKVIFSNVECLTYWLLFLTSFLFFCKKPKRSGRKQTTAMSSILNKKGANIVSLHRSLSHGSNPPQTDLQQTIKRISSNLIEGKITGGIRLPMT